MTLRGDPVDMNGRRLRLVPREQPELPEPQACDGDGNPLDDTSTTSTTSITNDPGPLPESTESPETHDKLDASKVIGNAVMHAAMSWVACCIEQPGVEVNVAQVGGGIFDAEVKLENGQSQWLRVTLALEYGPRLRTLVEPIHP